MWPWTLQAKQYGEGKGGPAKGGSAATCRGGPAGAAAQVFRGRCLGRATQLCHLQETLEGVVYLINF